MSPACLMGNDMGFGQAGTSEWGELVWRPAPRKSFPFTDRGSDGEGEACSDIWNQESQS